MAIWRFRHLILAWHMQVAPKKMLRPTSAPVLPGLRQQTRKHLGKSGMHAQQLPAASSGHGFATPTKGKVRRTGTGLLSTFDLSPLSTTSEAKDDAPSPVEVPMIS